MTSNDQDDTRVTRPTSARGRGRSGGSTFGAPPLVWSASPILRRKKVDEVIANFFGAKDAMQKQKELYSGFLNIIEEFEEHKKSGVNNPFGRVIGVGSEINELKDYISRELEKINENPQ